MTDKDTSEQTKEVAAEETKPTSLVKKTPKEFGGRTGPEPTRYGDWEKNGIISDF